MGTATVSVPDWLAKRDGALKPGVNGHTLFVLIGGAPQYKLEARPAAGKFICAIQQTVNGKRLDDGTVTYPDPAAALAGGLEELRTKLGW
ncbi:MAG: hypothetical protein JWO38_4809 [Gemmataceae bacterium]|nr:hypothetical protein [Gemmataceae bacterium]